MQIDRGMENYELCILGANRIKKLFLFFGFSFLIVCIIFGSYGDQHAVKQSSPQRQGGGLRRILELGYDEDDPQDAFDPNGTNEDIEVRNSVGNVNNNNNPAPIYIIIVAHNIYYDR